MSGESIALRANRLWSHGNLLEDVTVAVEAGKISGVFGRARGGERMGDVLPGSMAGKVGLEGLTREDGWTVLQMDEGVTLMPGMIDCHVHLVFPGDGSELHDALKPDDHTLLLRASDNAARALGAGVTTLVDAGAPGDIIFPLARGIESGVARGARVIPAGAPITITGGHCWPMGGQADTKEEVVTRVRAQMRDGAQLIKVMGTGGGTPGTNSYVPVYPREVLEAIVAEARRLDRRTLIHSGATVATRAAVRAGFDVIFHAHFHRSDGSLVYDDSLVEEMLSAGTWVNPTLWVNRVLGEVAEREARDGVRGAAERAETHKKRYDGQRENVARMFEAGVRPLMGSDSGWGHASFEDGLLRELQCASELGMSAESLLDLVTDGAAGFLGRDDLGALKPGAVADVVGVAGSPWREIRDLEAVEFVMSGGAVYAARFPSQTEGEVR
ncbi:MAG: amidohydrolase family protein [Bacillota bacterium]